MFTGYNTYGKLTRNQRLVGHARVHGNAQKPTGRGKVPVRDDDDDDDDAHAGFREQRPAQVMRDRNRALPLAHEG